MLNKVKKKTVFFIKTLNKLERHMINVKHDTMGHQNNTFNYYAKIIIESEAFSNYLLKVYKIDVLLKCWNFFQ